MQRIMTIQNQANSQVKSQANKSSMFQQRIDNIKEKDIEESKSSGPIGFENNLTKSQSQTNNQNDSEYDIPAEVILSQTLKAKAENGSGDWSYIIENMDSNMKR